MPARAATAIPIDVDPRPRLARAGQHGQRGRQHLPLQRPLAGEAEGMPKRKLDTDNTRGE